MYISVNKLAALYVLYGLITADRFYMDTKGSEVSKTQRKYYYTLVEQCLIEELTR